MNWDYVAGFMDGEGSIIIKPPRVRLYISNTDKDVLDKICKFLKCGRVFEVKRKPNKNWSKQYGWTICDHNECLRVLKNLKGKFVVKKDKCKEAINYIEGKRWLGNYLTKSELVKFGDISYRKIAKTLGVSHTTIFNYQKRYGLR